MKNGRGRPKRDDRSTERDPSGFKLTRGKKVADSLSRQFHPPFCICGSACCKNDSASASPVGPPPTPSTPIATDKRKTRGPDLKPRKERSTGKILGASGTQAGTQAETTGVVTGMEGGFVAERALAVTREAAVDADVAAGNW